MNCSGASLSALTGLVARLVLGSVFVYAGLNKALLPGDFLRVIADYQVTISPPIVRTVAALLPWFEVFCGLLLLAGVAVRGAALAVVLMILGFSGLILVRALDIVERSAVPLCSVAFDCGCGLSITAVCPKLAENLGLLLLGIFLTRSDASFARLRHRLLPSPHAN